MRPCATLDPEPGCVSFEVTQTHDPLVWQVDELFQDAESFAAHQQRAAGSEWARATAGIERRYEIDPALIDWPRGERARSSLLDRRLARQGLEAPGRGIQ